jgi:hypothetical protein
VKNYDRVLVVAYVVMQGGCPHDECKTSAECKTIGITKSSVMDGWDDRYLAQCRFYFQKWFSENGGRCRTEYSEGTTMAQERFRVPRGYYRGDGSGHV